MLNLSRGLTQLVFPVILGLLLAVCGGTTGTSTDGKFNGTINIASSTWTGYAIIYIATAKETWKSHGLDVKFTDVDRCLRPGSVQRSTRGRSFPHRRLGRW